MRAFLLIVIVFLAVRPAASAERDGVFFPDQQEVNGQVLHLNGTAIRTYSVLHVRIYVAGLYLTRPTRDADQILRSGETKLLSIYFLHDVTADQARTAWREGFEQNCPEPCAVDPAAMAKFIAAVPAMRKGETFTFVFNGRGVEIAAAGHVIGKINDVPLANLILASFIGPRPPTPRLKHELLGLP